MVSKVGNLSGFNIQIGSLSIFLHESICNWLLVLTGVGIFFVCCGNDLKKADPSKAPHGLALIGEILGKLALGIVGGNLKQKTWKYIPFYGTMMLCMVISNLFGLLGVQSPTSNLSVNMTLALMCVFLIHGTDIKLHGVIGKLKAWCEPMFFLFPLNVIGDLAFPISLTLRLFGNMLGGSIIVTLIYMLVKNLWPFSVVAFAITPFLHAYFDVFTAFMQTYIFFMLATYFLSQSCDIE